MGSIFALRKDRIFQLRQHESIHLDRLDVHLLPYDRILRHRQEHHLQIFKVPNAERLSGKEAGDSETVKSGEVGKYSGEDGLIVDEGPGEGAFRVIEVEIPSGEDQLFKVGQM